MMAWRKSKCTAEDIEFLAQNPLTRLSVLDCIQHEYIAVVVCVPFQMVRAVSLKYVCCFQQHRFFIELLQREELFLLVEIWERVLEDKEKGLKLVSE